MKNIAHPKLALKEVLEDSNRDTHPIFWDLILYYVYFFPISLETVFGLKGLSNVLAMQKCCHFELPISKTDGIQTNKPVEVTVGNKAKQKISVETEFFTRFDFKQVRDSVLVQKYRSQQSTESHFFFF